MLKAHAFRRDSYSAERLVRRRQPAYWNPLSWFSVRLPPRRCTERAWQSAALPFRFANVRLNPGSTRKQATTP